ncbi:MAG TPA: YdeI/OmpD-associated family protein [Vicinamibacterales bacterium]|nr:YdeI/OmpD-associated family protein [Vicinamibacterales bacterium]
MPTKDPRVDAYIAKSADFAKPILTRIRAAVHKGLPAATETIKWGVPAYVDDRGIVCMTAAFKRHCAWVFWTGRKPASVDVKAVRRITAAGELPGSRDLVAAVKEAAAPGTAGAKKAAKKAPKKRPAARPVKVPAYFMRALRKNTPALATFTAFPPSHKREYVEWVDSAKTDETRERRLSTAIPWIAAGKSRNWKYER